MMKVLGWGIVGCGKISGDFVQALKLRPSEHRVVAAASGDIGRAREFLTRHGVEGQPYGSYQDLFQDPAVEVVYVGNLNHQHKGSVVSALGAGKHVLCEKPMGVNAKETAEMIAAARANNRFLMEGYWSRFFPVAAAVKAAVAGGEIGTVRAILANFGYASHDENKYRGDGGGCLMATGVYLPMLVSHILWPDKPESIHATGRVIPSGVDESGTLTMYYSGGRMGSLAWNGAADYPNDLVIIGDRKGPTGTALSIKVPGDLWCPSRAELPSGPVEAEHPAGQANFHYPNGSGFLYEAAAVRRSILAGYRKTECAVMTLEESQFLAEVVDETRRQIGVRFPQDE